MTAELRTYLRLAIDVEKRRRLAAAGDAEPTDNIRRWTQHRENDDSGLVLKRQSRGGSPALAYLARDLARR